MSVNLTGPRFKVGDRVVHVERLHETGVVDGAWNGGASVVWSPLRYGSYLDRLLEPAERWQTDAERYGL